MKNDDFQTGFDQFHDLPKEGDFLVFVFNHYQPFGGVDDCKGRFANLQQAEDFAESEIQGERHARWHVLDIQKMAVVSSGDTGDI